MAIDISTGRTFENLIIPGFVVLSTVSVLFTVTWTQYEDRYSARYRGDSALSTSHFYASSIASITLDCVLVIDLLSLLKDAVSLHGKILACSILISSFLFDISNLSLFAPSASIQMFWSLQNSHNYVVGSSILLYLSRDSYHHHQNKISAESRRLNVYVNANIKSSLLILTLTIFVRSYSWERASFQTELGILQIISFVLLFMLMGFVAFEYYCCKDYINVVFSIVFILAMSTPTLLDVSFGAISVSMADITTYYATTLVFCRVAISYALFKLYSRYSGRLVIDNLINLLNMKEYFVRYVTREIRSPLQLVSLHLSLLKHRVAGEHKIMASRLEQIAAEHRIISSAPQPSRVTLSQVKRDVNSPVVMSVSLCPAEESRLGPVVEAAEDVLRDSIQACSMAVQILLELSPAENNSELTNFYESTTKQAVAVHQLQEVFEDAEIFVLLAKAGGIELILADLKASGLASVKLRIDKAQIKQVIGNLFSNAIKFTPHGKTVRVAVSRVSVPISLASISRRATGFIRIRVKDQGYGISKDNQKRLFKSVIQFNSNAHQGGGGSGIGLQMSYNIVKSHGGDMGVFSAGEGLGSEFWVDIPVLRGSVESNVSLRRSKRSIRKSQSLGNLEFLKLKVLIVDDSESILNILSRALVARGICDDADVEFAMNGGQAVTLISESMSSGEPYQLVLMDLLMPVMHGSEAVQLLRDIGFKGIILGITAVTNECDIVDFKECGANDVLIKPVDIEKLIALVRIYLKDGSGFLDVVPRGDVEDLRAPAQPQTKHEWSNHSIRDSGLNRNVSNRIFRFEYNHYSVTFFLFVQVVGLIFIFLPCWDSERKFASETALYESSEIFTATALSLVIGAALAVDVTLNASFRFVTFYEAAAPLIISLSIIIQGAFILAFCISTADLQTLECLLIARDYVTVMSFYFYQLLYGRHIWSNSFLFSSICCDIVRYLVCIYRSHLMVYPQDLDLLGFSCALIGTNIKLWVVRGCCERFLYHWKDSNVARVHAKLYTLLLLVIDLFGYIYLAVFGLQHPADVTEASLSIFLYMSTAVAGILLLVQSTLPRFARAEKNRTVRARQDTVRHVSHEVRTPLNIVFMGSQYLSSNVLDDYDRALSALNTSILSSDQMPSEPRSLALSLLQKMRVAVAADRDDILQLVAACKDAIAVLTDLLTYEKLNGSCLTLEMSAYQVRSAVRDFIAPIFVYGQDNIAFEFKDCFIPVEACISLDEKKLVYALHIIIRYLKLLLPSRGTLLASVELVSRCAPAINSRIHNSGILTSRFRSTKLASVEPVQSQITHLRIHISSVITSSKPTNLANIWLSRKGANDRDIDAHMRMDLGLHVSRGIITLHQGDVICNTPPLFENVEFVIDLPIHFSRQVEEKVEGQVPLGNKSDVALTPVYADAALPRAPDPRDVSVQGRAVSAPVDSRFELSERRVLCVDDSSPSLKLMCRILVANNICKAPHTACNGAEAVEKIRLSMTDGVPYHLVLMDSEMPVMDGPAAAARAREAGFTGVIIGVTGNGLPADIEIFVTAGANNVIVKPIIIESLKAIIADLAC